MPQTSQLSYKAQNSSETQSNGSSSIQNTGVAVKLWRPAVPEDVAYIQQLICPTTIELFGEFEIYELIETSPFSIVVEDVNEEIIAFVCGKNFPNIPAVNPECWSEWITTHYDISNITPDNTFFIHCLLWNTEYSHKSFQHVMKSLFLNLISLKNICLVIPPGVSTYIYGGDMILKKFFKRYLPLELIYADKKQILYCCERESTVPKMKIRKAIAEDNHDLIEILDKLFPQLIESRGKNYIAEIVLDENPSKQIVVADHDNQAVGLLCLNSSVDVTKLFKIFKLEAFHGLRKHCSEENPEENAQTGSDETQESYQQMPELILNFDELPFNGSDSSHSSESYNTDYSSESYAVSIKESSTDLFFTETLKALATDSSHSSSESEPEDDELESRNSMMTIMKTKKLQFKSGLTSTQLKEYTTEPSVFEIELYGLRDDFDQRVAVDMLESAFETYPDCDYCIIFLPSDQREFPLLHQFTKVLPRSINNSQDDLFVLHRSCFLSSIEVRYANKFDLPEILEMLGSIHRNKIVYSDLHKSVIQMATTNYIKSYPFVITCEARVIGVVLLEPFSDIDYLRANFDLDFHIKHENHQNHANIFHFILSPIVSNKVKQVFLEISRLTSFTSFYYMSKEILKKSNHYISHIYDIFEMTPIRPRCRIKYDENIFNQYFAPKHIQRKEPEYALYHMGINTCLSKRRINTRIVIFGASAVAISFLETLIFHESSKNTWFTNITLVSPCGILDVPNDIEKKLQLLFPHNGMYSSLFLHRLGIRTWVNIIHGSLHKIDTKLKNICLEDDQVIKYDNLYLMNDLQFDVPRNVENVGIVPANVILMNNIIDAEVVDIKINIILNRMVSFNIVVYGNCLESYCCLNYLLSKKVPPNFIQFIQFPIENETHHFHDSFIELKMNNKITELGIINHRYFKFHDWEVDDNNMIRKLNFVSDLKNLQMDCILFFCFERKTVGQTFYDAITSSDILNYDGRVVIDDAFRTSDPSVYAAGPTTKYDKKYLAEIFEQEHFCQTEIGRVLGKKTILKESPNPALVNQPEKTRTFPLTVQRFRESIVCNCLLPGGYKYLNVQIPGARKVTENFDNLGIFMSTGGAEDNIPKTDNETDDQIRRKSFFTKSDFWNFVGDTKLTTRSSTTVSKNLSRIPNDYFKIHVNEYHLVDHIVCFTKKTIDVENIIKIWGKHEKLLNNLVLRFEANMITDFYKFFREPWAYAIYHDRFNKLQELNQSDLLSDQVEDTNLLKIISEKIIENNHQKLTEDQRVEIVELYSSSKYQEILQENLLKFIEDNQDSLFMLLHPKDVSKYQN